MFVCLCVGLSATLYKSNEPFLFRVSTTPGNPGNLLEFKWSSWKFLCNDRKFYFIVNGFTT